MTFAATMFIDTTFYKDLDYYDQNNFYNQKHLYSKQEIPVILASKNIITNDNYNITIEST